MPDPSRVHRSATNVMSIAMIVIGVVLLVRTILAGASALALGILLGALFIVAGAARLYLQRSGRPK